MAARNSQRNQDTAGTRTDHGIAATRRGARGPCDLHERFLILSHYPEVTHVRVQSAEHVRRFEELL